MAAPAAKQLAVRELAEKAQRAQRATKRLASSARDATRALAELQAFCAEHAIKFEIDPDTESEGIGHG